MKTSNKISRRTFLADTAKGAIALGMGAFPLRAQETSPADLILIGAPVLTVDSNNTVKQALAVKGHQIVAVGNDIRSILELAGTGTKILQLPRTQCVTPGMIDVHNHIVAQASNTIGWVDLIRLNSTKQLRETSANWIIANDGGPGTWVGGIGCVWPWDKILSSSEDPEHPIHLVKLIDLHATANALALRRARDIDDSGQLNTGSNAKCLTLPGKKRGGKNASPTCDKKNRRIS